jgi:hypothetical protein
MTNSYARVLAAVAVVLVATTALPAAALATHGAQPVSDRADLTIQQPHYVDSSVEVTRGSNATTYGVRGSHFEILPENFDASNVVNYGVQQDGATLSFDKRTGEYIFDTGGQAGTFQVYWTVSETRQTTTAGNNSSSANTTSTVSRVRYTAQIQTSTGGFAHISKQKLNGLREDSENWSAVVSTFGSIGSDDVSIEKKLQTAANWYQFSTNPFSALSGDMTATILMLVLTQGGLLVLGLIVLTPVAVFAPVAIKYRRLKDRLPDVDELDTEKLKQWRRLRKKKASEVTPHDLPLNGRTADKIQDILGENLVEIEDTVQRIIDHQKAKRVYLQAMAYRGDTAEIERGSDDEIINVTLHGPEDRSESEGATPLDDLGDDKFDRVVEVADWSQVDLRSIRKDIPLDAVDVPISPTDTDDDLAAELEVSFPEDFESREVFAEALYEIWKYLGSHSYTDDNGAFREEQTLLNIFSMLTTVTSERYDHPDTRMYRDLFQYIASEVDGNAQLRQAAEEDGLGLDSLDGRDSLTGSGGESGAD